MDPSEHASIKVLIVDDQEVIREAFGMLLSTDVKGGEKTYQRGGAKPYH